MQITLCVFYHVCNLLTYCQCVRYTLCAIYSMHFARFSKVCADYIRPYFHCLVLKLLNSCFCYYYYVYNYFHFVLVAEQYNPFMCKTRIMWNQRSMQFLLKHTTVSSIQRDTIDPYRILTSCSCTYMFGSKTTKCDRDNRNPA